MVYSKSLIKKIIDEVFKGVKTSQTPFLLIKYGPSGSGKSSAMNLVSEYLGIFDNEKVVIDLDKIVERDPSYDGSMDSYWEARKSGAEKITDLIMERALTKKNTLEIETTGRNIKQVFEYGRKAMYHGFTVIVIYPIVSYDELNKRLDYRLRQTGQRRPSSKLLSDMVSHAKCYIKMIAQFVDKTFVINNSIEKPGIAAIIERDLESEKIDNCETIPLKGECFPTTKKFLDQEFIKLLNDVCK